MNSSEPVLLARTTRTDGRPVFEDGVSIPDDPAERAALRLSSLRGIDTVLGDSVEATYGDRSIGTLYHAISVDGVDAVAAKLKAATGVDAAIVGPRLALVKRLVDEAGYYDVVGAPTSVSVYLTEAGGLLTDPGTEAATSTAQRVTNAHNLAKELAHANLAGGAEPLEKIHPHTQKHLLENLAELFQTVQGGEGVPEVIEEKGSQPGLRLPDHAARKAGAVDSITLTGDGVVKDVSVTVDISHSHRGHLDVYLVAPDGTEAHLKALDANDGARDLQATYTSSNSEVERLQGRPMQGAWKLRVADAFHNDTGVLNSWSLAVRAAGARGDTQELRHAEQKAFFAGVGALLQHLTVAGTPEGRLQAMATLAPLIKACPFFDVRMLLAAGVQQRYGRLTADCQRVFNTEIKPLVAPAAPDYDAIYRVDLGADGTSEARKRTLNCAVYFGDEKDDAIFKGGLKLLKKSGFAEAQSDRPGFLLLTKATEQVQCDEIRIYVKHMNGRNMLELMGDESIDVIMYDGHSNLGRNLENSVLSAPQQKGSKLVMVGACATTDRVFAMRHKYPDPIRTQLVNTYESSYFQTSTVDDRQIMTSSENNDLMVGLLTALAASKPWNEIEDVLRRATSSWGHTVAVNYTNPSKLGELLALLDMDRDGVPDYGDPVYNGELIVVPERVREEFTAAVAPGAVGSLDGTKVFATVQSLDTIGRYNPLVRKLYDVRTLVSDGFVDLGQDGPMVSVRRSEADKRWHVGVNSRYSHASVEALRACAHYEFGLRAAKASGRIATEADRKLYALIFAAASLKYDSGYADERVWAGLLQRYQLPEGLALSDFFEVLRVEYDERHGELSGGVRNIADIKKRITDSAILRRLDDPSVGVWA